MDDDDNFTYQDQGDDDGDGDNYAQTGGNSSVVIINTLKIYGTIFVVLFGAFCVARVRYPMVYSPRSWVKKLYTRLAEDHYGYFNWIPYVLRITDEQLMDECGMDALCYIRLLKFGMRISFFGSLVALCLMPIYGATPKKEDTSYIEDPLDLLTISNVPKGSPRFYCTVIACYLVYGFVMYSFLKETEWYNSNRRRFLTKPLPRNHTVFIRFLPEEYNTSDKLLKLYERIYSENDVAGARVNMLAPRLKKKVNERDAILSKLEKAIAERNIDGNEPTHTTALVGGDRVNSIESYSKNLDELNREISSAIDELVSNGRSEIEMNDSLGSGAPVVDGSDTDFTGKHLNITDIMGPTVTDSTTRNIRDFLATPVGAVETLAQAAKETIFTGEEGKALGSGFVTFNSLLCVHSTIQDIQHFSPHTMQVMQSPSPDDVFWNNMGITHKQIEYGKLVSFSLTALLFLNWTVITTSVQLFSSIEGIRKVPKIGKYFDKFMQHFPWAEVALTQLAPVLLVVSNLLLRMLLTQLSSREGPISNADIQRKLFVKLAIFAICQTFFVSAISGGLMDIIQPIIDHPENALLFLGKSLPSKSTFFIQFSLVNCFPTMGLEILRLVPIAFGWFKKCSGIESENVHQERGYPHWDLRAFADIAKIQHGQLYSFLILYFLIFLVYASISPISSFFIMICCAIINLIYRNQLIYVDTWPDSGGILWSSFMDFLPYCLLIGELTITGLLGLNLAPRAASCMAPLTLGTLYFIYYTNQLPHKRTNLSAIDCMLVDSASNVDFQEASLEYVQPELRVKVARPYNEKDIPNYQPVAP